MKYKPTAVIPTAISMSVLKFVGMLLAGRPCRNLVRYRQ